jgi:hypothetical protein
MKGEWVIERSSIPEKWDREYITPARPGHWTAIMSDEYDNEPCVTLLCILRSEMLACLALLCRQMNKQYAWNSGERFDGWELDVQDGPIKVVNTSFFLHRRVY